MKQSKASHKVKLLQVTTLGKPAGWLCHEPSTNTDTPYVFHYSSGNQTQAPVSLLMPPTQTLWQGREVFPVFAQHLPQGELLAALRQRGYACEHPMQLLELIGHHGLGWLGYTNPDAPVVKPRYTFSRSNLLSSGNSHTMFNELLDEYIAHGCGIGGNTMKIMLPTTPGIPVPDVIVKYAMPNEKNSQRSLVREFEVLQAAKQQGIACANASLSSCERLLLIERFDIQANGKRMGLESFNSLLGFNASKNASYELVAQMIELFSSTPKRCLERFFEQLVTHLLSGSSASLSKFSLLYDDKGKVELAPLYGVNSIPDAKKRVSWPLHPAVTLFRKNSAAAIQSIEELERFGSAVCGAHAKSLVKTQIPA